MNEYILDKIERLEYDLIRLKHSYVSGDYTESVQAVDAIAENLGYEEFEKKVLDFSPDILLSEISTPSLAHDLDILFRIKNKNQLFFVFQGACAFVLHHRHSILQ